MDKQSKLSKNRIKFINSLKIKKIRDRENLFVAEGEKIVTDLAKRLNCRLLVCNEDFAKRNQVKADEIIVINTYSEANKISSLTTPNHILALFVKPTYPLLDLEVIKNKICLVLDYIQDPGNFGTIVRIADWFGIENIICSGTTADIFNPKVVQATMGALSNVNIYYRELPDFLAMAKEMEIPIYGAFLDGENIYHKSLNNRGLIVVGNEGNGISPQIANLITHKITIPSFSSSGSKSESLNVAAATAVVCSEFKRTSR